jgi:hypothetical protein
VRLADDARKCVVFFGSSKPKVDDDINPWGTGFLVTTGDTGTVYLVTAAHVISQRQDCPFAVRFNKPDGGAHNHYIDRADWQFHSDVTVDIAVLEIEPPEWADYKPWPQKPGVMDDFKFESKNIGPGDVIYTVALWDKLRGKKKNKPFVHVGHIGMVPQDDKIQVKNWIPGKIDDPVDVEAYLTEGEPLFGASGSPVFVRRSIELGKGLYKSDPNAKTWIYGNVFLLGLMSDSYMERAIIERVGLTVVPRGVNIVVPSMKINEILDKQELKEKRANDAKERRMASAVLPEKLSASPANHENPSHREDFDSLLNKAAKPPKAD